MGENNEKAGWTAELEQLVFDVHDALSKSETKPTVLFPMQVVNRIKKAACNTPQAKVTSSATGTVRVSSRTVSRPLGAPPNPNIPSRGRGCPSMGNGPQRPSTATPHEKANAASSEGKGSVTVKGKGKEKAPVKTEPEDSSSSISPVTMPLNGDVIREIMTKLPEKDLQSWYSAGSYEHSIIAMEERVSRLKAKVSKYDAPKEVIDAIRQEVEHDLAHSLPTLEGAVAALNTLHRHDINELASFARPPAVVQNVISALIVLISTKKRPDTSWTAGKKLVKSPGFLRDLINFDRDSVTLHRANQVGTMLGDLTVDATRAVSMAAAGLHHWIVGVIQYTYVLATLEAPRRVLREFDNVPKVREEIARCEGVIAKLKEKEKHISCEKSMGERDD